MRRWTAALVLYLSGTGPQTACADDPSRPSAYCGVQSLARVLRAYGKEIDFADLLKPEYISQRSGSTADDLVRAAGDFGLTACVKARLSCRILEWLESPVILHVKVHPSSPTYNHWVLYAGVDTNGMARIYDAHKPVKSVGFEALAATWDGNAILIEYSPWRYYLATLSHFALFVGIVFGTLAFIHWLSIVCLRKLTFTKPTLLILQTVVLVVCALSINTAFRITNPGGFLSDNSSISAVQDRFLASFLPHCEAEVVEDILSKGQHLIVDARTPASFKEGHMPGAVSMPYYLPANELKKEIKDIPLSKPVLIYCESQGCYFSQVVAKKFSEIGFSNIVVYREGWKGWQVYKGKVQNESADVNDAK